MIQEIEENEKGKVGRKNIIEQLKIGEQIIDLRNQGLTEMEISARLTAQIGKDIGRSSIHRYLAEHSEQLILKTEADISPNMTDYNAMAIISNLQSPEYLFLEEQCAGINKPLDLSQLSILSGMLNYRLVKHFSMKRPFAVAIVKHFLKVKEWVESEINPPRKPIQINLRAPIHDNSRYSSTVGINDLRESPDTVSDQYKLSIKKIQP